MNVNRASPPHLPSVEDAGPQHLQAFAQANRVRVARAEVKRQLKAGEMSFEDALYHPMTQTMTVFDLLSAQHRWGRDRVLKVLAPFHISELKQVGALTDRQRTSILANLLRGS